MKKNKMYWYHERVSQYVKSHRWLSISSNEIVEYNIRSLVFGDELMSPNIFLRSLIFTFFICWAIILLPVYFLVVSAFFTVVYFRRERPSESLSFDDVFFIRNSLSKRKYELLLESKLLDGTTVVVDDFEFEYNNKQAVKLSVYLRYTPVVYATRLLKELIYITHDFSFNVPRVNVHKILRAYTRVPHLILLDLSLSKMFEINNVKHIRTFEMISRFSSLLNLIRHEYSVDTATCYPHGLEYDIYYPRGYFGNTVFSTSKYASEKLNDRYETSCFVFDDKLIKSLFIYDVEIKEHREFVYYTDARNIKDDYSNLVSLQGDVKYLKLHPIDDLSNYPNIDMTPIEDFYEAISYGAIIMRASTVLFEGFNSNCLVYCLSTNDKEKYLTDYLYPTLSTLDIKKVSSLSELELKKEI